MDKAYKNIIFDIQQGTGISGAFSQIPKSRIEQVLKENWSGHHYSTRIWNNTEKLADEVKQSLIESFMTGAGEREAAEAIQEKFSVGANEARRLIRTENTYITGQAELEGYKTAQVEEYEYAALIDGRTSEICKALDGKFFKITEAQAGKNYPPMHTYCRSSTMAKLPSEEELEQAFDKFRADNIPEGMDFEEWLDGLEPTEDGKLVFRDKRVDKSAESGIIKKDSKKPITVITDKSVNNVSKVKIPGYADEECDFIYRQHKELLEYSRENNKSYETAFVFEKLFKPRKPYIGTDDSLDFGEPLYGTDLFVMHNHPRNNSFSLNDIIFFWSNSNVKTLTIVKNSGDVEYITKSSNYNSSVLKLEYDRLYKDIIVNNTDFEKNKLIKKLLTKTRSGVIWSGG